jgi:transporter family-2 protein
MPGTNQYIFLFVALLIGASLSMQVGVNAKLGEAVGSPLISALLSFCVGTIALLSYILITGIPIANAVNAKNASPVAWTGGLLGAFFVATSIILLDKLGAAMTISLIIAGQMLMSLIMDHYGLLGVDVKPISLGRVAGVVLVVAGVILIRRF